MSLADFYDAKARLIVEYQDFPAMVAATSELLQLFPSHVALAAPDDRKMLDSIEKNGNATMRSWRSGPGGSRSSSRNSRSPWRNKSKNGLSTKRQGRNRPWAIAANSHGRSI